MEMYYMIVLNYLKLKLQLNDGGVYTALNFNNAIIKISNITYYKFSPYNFRIRRVHQLEIYL